MILACNGLTTSATVIASGGTMPYTYTLNGSSTNTTGIFNNLAAGSYNVYITDAMDVVILLHLILINLHY
jgi:hypothetical protein